MATTIAFPELSQEFQVGLLSFGREAGLKAADMALPHPDNYVGWQLLATEVLYTVANFVGKKIPASVLAKAVPTFRTNYIAAEPVAKLFDELAELIVSSITAMAPEDMFSEYKASQVKRAMSSAANALQKTFDAKGHLVVFQMIYLSSLAVDEDDDVFTLFVSAILDEEMPQMYHPAEILKHVKAVNKTYKSWDKSNVRIASKMEYVELDVEESIA